MLRVERPARQAQQEQQDAVVDVWGVRREALCQEAPPQLRQRALLPILRADQHPLLQAAPLTCTPHQPLGIPLNATQPQGMLLFRAGCCCASLAC